MVELAAEVTPAGQAEDAIANLPVAYKRRAPSFPSGEVLSMHGTLDLKQILTREIAFLGDLSKPQPFDADVTKAVLKKVRFAPT